MSTTIQIALLVGLIYLGIVAVIAIEWFARIRENPENRPGGGSFAVWLVAVLWPVAVAGLVLGILLIAIDLITAPAAPRKKDRNRP